MAKKYYAVKIGHKPGIFESWAECEAQTKGFGGAIFQSFKSLEQAEIWLNESSNQLKPEPYGELGAASGSINKVQTTLTSTSAFESEVDKAILPNEELKIDTQRYQIANNFSAFLTGTEFEVSMMKAYPYFTRLKFLHVGHADLYMTAKKMYPSFRTSGSMLNPEQKKKIKRLWREFSVRELPLSVPEENRENQIKDLLERFRPFSGLKFDFIHLAKAVIADGESDINVNDIRYNFNRIEELFKEVSVTLNEDIIDSNRTNHNRN
jgi:hypothetical protein